MTKVYFPREILPLAVGRRGAVDFVLPGASCSCCFMVIRAGLRSWAELLLLPLSMFALLLFTIGAGHCGSAR